jgi:hypothetical protein
MALPAFSKTNHPLGTLTFSRPYVFPVDEDRAYNQIITYSRGGPAGGSRAIQVADLGGIEKTLTLTFENLPDTEVDSIRTWLEHSFINLSVNNFTFTDVASVAKTVRFVGNALRKRWTSTGLVASFELLLRIES